MPLPSVLKTLDRVDKIVENAGVYFTKFETAEEDEVAITVYIVSTFLLTLLLLLHLRESGRMTGIMPIISITGSFVHLLTQFPERNEKEGIFATLANKDKADMRDRCVIASFLSFLSFRHLFPLNVTKELW
jgi:retinol dehydrogenase-12